ncbi:hypothetical protein H0H93_004644, partial [Arthromyces matolae]
MEDDEMELEEGEGLRPEGICLVQDVRSQREGTGETRRQLSWIWTTGEGSSAAMDDEDLLKSEWAK